MYSLTQTHVEVDVVSSSQGHTKTRDTTTTNHHHHQDIFTEIPRFRGKKAAIQLLDEETSLSNTPTNQNTTPTTSASVGSIGGSQGHYEPESSSSTSRQRWKSLVGRVVASPVMSYFTCTSSSTSSNNDDMDAIKGGRSLFGFSGRSSYYTTYFKKAIHSGAPVAVVQTMKQFPYQGRIQRLGCGALRDLAVDSWTGKVQVAETPGAIEAILKAMRIHSKDAKLQEIACKCLYELVAGDLPSILIQKGVVTTLLTTTLEIHVQDEDVVPVALDVLLALTDHGGPAGVEALRHKLGGVVLAKLEHSFRGLNPDICKKSGELLRRLYM